MMRRLREIPCRLLARTALQRSVLVDLIQCASRTSQFQEKHLFRFPQLAQRVVQDNQSPNERSTGSVTEFFQSQGRYQHSFKYMTHTLSVWLVVNAIYSSVVQYTVSVMMACLISTHNVIRI